VGEGPGVVALGCAVGRRRGSDPALLWLWWRLAATAPIRPLAWESPFAAGVALEKTKSPPPQKAGACQCVAEDSRISVHWDAGLQLPFLVTSLSDFWYQGTAGLVQ